MSQSTPTDHEIDVYAGEFVLGGDKTKAWKKTFPKSQAKQEVTHVAAQKMHNLGKVLVRIEQLQCETAQKDAEEFDRSASELKSILDSVIAMGLGKELPEGLSGKAAEEMTLEDKILAMSKINLGAVTSAVAEWNRMNGNHAAQKINANVVTMTHEEWLSSLDD